MPQVQPNRGSSTRPPNRDNTFHVTETPVLTTQLSVTFNTDMRKT